MAIRVILSDQKIMETELSKKKPGSNVDSWCGKCKLVLAHTIEAVVDGKPARVTCNTCKAQHGYKPNPPRGAASKKEGATPAPRTLSGNRYQSLLKAKDVGTVKNYSPTGKYEAGDILEHPKFGRGVTTAVKDATKIEVLFESGPKTLIHAR